MEKVFSSSLRASPEMVWRWATSAAGVNGELMPLLRMTGLRAFESLDAESLQPGKPICTSWLLLFGILPVDRVRLTLVDLKDGVRFVEQSPMASMRLWRHERTILGNGSGGSILEDRLTFRGRFPDGITGAVVGFLFTHRHTCLRRHFGTAPPGNSATV